MNYCRRPSVCHCAKLPVQRRTSLVRVCTCNLYNMNMSSTCSTGIGLLGPAPVTPPTLAPVPSTPAPVISQPTNWQCSDSPLRFRTYSFVGAVVWRGCPWVSNKPYRCLDSNHATHCPSTCNGCNTCQDSTIRFKLVKDGKLIARDCGWVGTKQTKIRCGYNNVAQTCPQTCGLC